MAADPWRPGAVRPPILALRAALAALPPRQRTVIVLRYYEDLSERETTELMGIAVGTVKSTSRDALVRLRGLLPDEDRTTIERGAGA